jgi:hypothetical protein
LPRRLRGCRARFDRSRGVDRGLAGPAPARYSPGECSAPEGRAVGVLIGRDDWSRARQRRPNVT